MTRAARHLLPKGYPSSVSPSYLRYVLWQSVGSVASAAGGVLSMQSLLTAVGIGTGAAPLAAAINWVLKDGLGQLGGVIFTSMVNNRFDRDVKRWRMLSAATLDASTLLEVMTPLVPALFVPMATVSNIGKNMAWLSASATRAGIHQALTINGGNLADVTAKTGSQTVVASAVGTALGIGLVPIAAADPAAVLGLFACCSAIHLTCVHQGLAALQLPTLNTARSDAVIRCLLEDMVAGVSPSEWAAPTPADVAQEERPLVEIDPMRLPLHERVSRNRQTTSSSSGLEWGTGPDVCVGPALQALAQPQPAADPANWHAPDTSANASAAGYCVFDGGDDGVVLLLDHHCAPEWVWRGYLHANLLRAARSGPTAAAIARASSCEPTSTRAIVAEFMRLHSSAVLEAVSGAGWWLHQPLLEADVGTRVHVKADA